MPKIKAVHYFKAVSPLSRPIADSTHTIPEIGFLVTRIELDNGVTGDANLLSFHYSPQAIIGALRHISSVIALRRCAFGFLVPFSWLLTETWAMARLRSSFETPCLLR